VKNHWFVFNEKMKVESVAQSVGDLALRFGEGADGEDALMASYFFKINIMFRYSDRL
jgi:20S proteasome subunit alpha 5